MRAQVGTPVWMSPELLDQQAEYGREVDLYSFAIVVNEMLTSELPWRSLAPGRHNLVTAVLVEKRRPEIPDDTPIALREIVEACWQHDPARRPVCTTMIRSALLVPRRGQIVCLGVVHALTSWRAVMNSANDVSRRSDKYKTCLRTVDWTACRPRSALNCFAHEGICTRRLAVATDESRVWEQLRLLTRRSTRAQSRPSQIVQ